MSMELGPYTNFHELNLDWFLNEFNKVVAEWAEMKKSFSSLNDAFTDLRNYVNDYFKNLDVQEEIDKKLDAMASDGSLSALLNTIIVATLPPYVVDSVDAMKDINRTYILKSDSHIYQHNSAGWVDTNIVYGSTIGNVVTYLGQLPSGGDLNNLPVQSIYLVAYESASNMPVIDSGFVYTFGISGAAIEQLYIRFSDGRTWYRRHVGTTWASWRSNFISYDGILSSGSDLNNIATQSIYLVQYTSASNMPVNDSGFVYTFGLSDSTTEQLYIRFSDGRNWYRNRSESGTWSEWSSNCVRYDGILARGTDFNTVTEQSVYLCAAPIEYPNIPTNESGFLLTLGSTTNAMQMYIEFTNGKVYYRRRNYQGNWAKWIAKPDIGNSFAHMYSIGNSILTGSVWLNGEYDHLAEYGNAPYSVVADAISIPKENVTHRLVSATGLLYDAGAGSFLSNIKKVDLTPYDVLLTHFYTEDMNNFNVGSVNSNAGDGTLSGAVMELLDYIKTSNSMCQLILVSVVPVSSVIYGNNVFSGKYPNGSSIKDLDVLMKELASKYHFTYIDWQDLNISYNYHDYTDGLNVHANNENTYRVMGAYLGGRASSKINF